MKIEIDITMFDLTDAFINYIDQLNSYYLVDIKEQIEDELIKREKEEFKNA